MAESVRAIPLSQAILDHFRKTRRYLNEQKLVDLFFSHPREHVMRAIDELVLQNKLVLFAGSYRLSEAEDTAAIVRVQIERYFPPIEQKEDPQTGDAILLFNVEGKPRFCRIGEWNGEVES